MLNEVMAQVLLADEPRTDIAQHLEPFRRLIGSWDVTIINHQPDGGREIIDGEWHFGWALDGRALADVWIAPRRSVRARTGDNSGEWGLTIRFYDERIDAWRSTWLGPKKGVVMPFIARDVDGGIVLRGSFEEGVLTQWAFSDITADTFQWRNTNSRDDRKTWQLTQEMSATRSVAT